MSRPVPDSPHAGKVHPSPNHGERRNGLRPSILVLHYTGMADHEAGALRRLCDPLSEVSAHYFVFEDGRVLQLVPEARRAWHAGAGCWQGERDVNSASIGIELAHPGHAHGYRPFADAQVEAVTRLAADVAARWRIAPDRIIGHSDMAPGRKADPGELFPWRILHEAGVGLWVPERPITGGRFLADGDSGPPVEALQAMLGLYGYDVPVDGVFDGGTADTVRAFQRHFRPALIDGVADASTITTLRDLIRARDAAVAATASA